MSEPKIICFDIETFDPNLIGNGPGVYRKDGYVLGVGIATDQGFAEYFNLGHEGITEEEKATNLEIIKNYLENDIPKLGTNLLYDLDWLVNGLGLEIGGEWNDVQLAEPLVDENAMSYSLDALSKKYLGIGKAKSNIERICENMGWKGDARKHLYKMSYEDVREYVLGDVQYPIEIFKEQKRIMEEEDLVDLYQMEIHLLPLYLQMRKTGVRIDVGKLSENIAYLEDVIEEAKEDMFFQYGRFNLNSSRQKANVLTRLGIPVPKTDKGNPKTDKATLAKIDHPFAKMFLDVNAKEKVLTYLKKSIMDQLVDGRVHCSFNPLRGPRGGTVSGRFSSSNPNLQQVKSVRSEDPHDLGRMAREVFIPEPDHLWGKIDYSQIEYRIIAHYAVGPKSQDIKKAYNEDPKTDYHAWVMGMTGLPRKEAKVVNFGSAYSMGARSLAENQNWAFDKAQEILSMYHREVPFVKYTSNRVMDKAVQRDNQTGKGFIKTILGRRARISDRMRLEGKQYSLFNRLIQGSAADLLKKALLDAWEEGIFDIITPHLLVHDEIDLSIPDTPRGHAAYIKLKEIMETCVEMKVPIIADAEIGTNWADVKEYRPYDRKRNP
jgi:DNA polymerase I-like protein with 3'-5' exonuclease and polymerase domains